MKTGTIRRIDDLGRVVVPREIRRKLGIKEGDPLEISLDGNKVVFELYFPTYNHEQHIKQLIEMLEQDEFLVEKLEHREAQKKAVAALKEAYNELHQTERKVEGE